MQSKNFDHPPVFAESPASASIQTVEGWVSRTGYFYGNDEATARRHGSTHRICERNPAHGAVENRSYCEACVEDREEDRWAKLPKLTDLEFASTEEFFLFDGDVFFQDFDTVLEYMADNDMTEIRLIEAIPNYMKIGEAGDTFSDDCPDDYNVDDRLEAADVIIAEANERLRELGPLSWGTGKRGYEVVRGAHGY